MEALPHLRDHSFIVSEWRNLSDVRHALPYATTLWSGFVLIVSAMPKQPGAMGRLRTVVLVGLVGVVAASTLALAAQTNGGPGGRDFIEATVKGPLPTSLGTFPARYSVAAESRSPGGTPARGRWFAAIIPTGPFASLGTVFVDGPAICVNAAGNSASWRGIIEDSNQPGVAPPGFGVLSRLVDNGEGANDPPDQSVTFLTPPPGPLPTCPPIPFTTGPNLQGRIYLHDGV